MDKQLSYLVRQTERYTKMLAVNLLSGGAQGSHIHMKKHSTKLIKTTADTKTEEELTDNRSTSTSGIKIYSEY